MNLSYQQALQGRLPDKLPSEIYCHTLTDDSILSPDLRAQGFHTMTLFGLDTPWRLFAQNNEAMRQRAEQQFVEELNGWLAEPLGRLPCYRARWQSLHRKQKSGRHRGSTRALPWQYFPEGTDVSVAETKEQVGTWGVETEFENVFLCGASAHRGGAVSGIPGHNAAMKVLEIIKTR